MIPRDNIRFTKPSIIGIAGNIGAGKSIVSRILRCNGFDVYDCDREASRLMNNDIEVKHRLVDVLGKQCYNANGLINKPYVSACIFNDDNLRKEINEIVHAAVKNDFIEFAQEKMGKVFIESAILATSGLEKICDKIWLVDAPEDIRLNRVIKRNNLSVEAVRKRMYSQKDELAGLSKEKIVIIENDYNAQVLTTVLHLLYPQQKSVDFVLMF